MRVERGRSKSHHTTTNSTAICFPIKVRLCSAHIDLANHLIPQHVPTVSHTHSIAICRRLCEMLMATRVRRRACDAVAMGNSDIPCERGREGEREVGREGES